MLSKHKDVILVPEIHSLEDYMANPPDGMEWVDGELVEKTGITLKHSEIQFNLGFYWRSYINSNQQGGKVYTEVPCLRSCTIVLLRKSELQNAYDYVGWALPTSPY